VETLLWVRGSINPSDHYAIHSASVDIAKMVYHDMAALPPECQWFVSA
jgi:hypothetical protein